MRREWRREVLQQLVMVGRIPRSAARADAIHEALRIEATPLVGIRVEKGQETNEPRGVATYDVGARGDRQRRRRRSATSKRTLLLKGNHHALFLRCLGTITQTPFR